KYKKFVKRGDWTFLQPPASDAQAVTLGLGYSRVGDWLGTGAQRQYKENWLRHVASLLDVTSTLAKRRSRVATSRLAQLALLVTQRAGTSLLVTNSSIDPRLHLPSSAGVYASCLRSSRTLSCRAIWWVSTHFWRHNVGRT
ncbi:unnamed protein product, partial [Ectocarpus sp. 13 AM-2016]